MGRWSPQTIPEKLLSLHDFSHLASLPGPVGAIGTEIGVIMRMMLTPKEKFDLTVLVRAKFTESGMDDGKFAALSTVELGFPVNAAHVWGVRNAFDIPANRASGREIGLVLRLEKLENLVHAMRAELGMVRLN